MSCSTRSPRRSSLDGGHEISKRESAHDRFRDVDGERGRECRVAKVDEMPPCGCVRLTVDGQHCWGLVRLFFNPQPFLESQP
jgi:hypothetical protein